MPTAAQRLLGQAQQNGWSMTVDGDLTTASATTAWDAVKIVEGGAHVDLSERDAPGNCLFGGAWSRRWPR